MWSVAADGTYTAQTYSTAPTLTAAATGSNKVTLYWTGTPGASGYNVYRGTSAGGEDYTHPVNGATPVTAASYSGSPMDMYSDTGLSDGTEYFYTVKAVYGNGQSQASNEDSDVPDPSAVPWDTRSPVSILSAVRSAYSTDEPNIINLRVVGPDGAVYDDAFSAAQLPDGVLNSDTNQVTLCCPGSLHRSQNSLPVRTQAATTTAVMTEEVRRMFPGPRFPTIPISLSRTPALGFIQNEPENYR